ncbi:unnamed protein product [Gongylonema pulchrum]|uniref:Uncharacterized protein n=2 Tax=Gongylonema pulchrum TaxID=637853 RepID=A0A3P6PZH2_9BILA|nr:unnamed protein product [Gongylonema pulchrum]
MVNRELRFLNAKRDELSKMKRLLHSSSRDLEKVEQLIDNDQVSNIKLSVKKRKLLEQVIKQEHTYIEETIATERQRRVTDGVLRKGVQYLEMFERYMNALNDAVGADPDEQISMIVPTCSANHTVYLCDFHAENFGEVMASQRRRWALERVNAIIQEHLERSQQELMPMLPSANVANFGYTEFLEYLIYKIDEALKSIDGAQNRAYHRLLRFQQKLKDKMVR